MRLAMAKHRFFVGSLILLAVTLSVDGQAKFSLVVPGKQTAVSQRTTIRTIDVLLKAPKDTLTFFTECKKDLVGVLEEISEDTTLTTLNAARIN